LPTVWTISSLPVRIVDTAVNPFRRTANATVDTRISWWGVLLVVLAGLQSSYYGAYWATMLSMAAMSTAVAGWKCVQLLGHVLVQVQAAALNDEEDVD
jgi:hypothetical protein